MACLAALQYVRRDKLVPDLPLVHNGGLEFGADLIVEDLKINVMPTVGKAVHDGVVGSQPMFVGPVNKGCRGLRRMMYWLPM